MTMVMVMMSTMVVVVVEVGKDSGRQAGRLAGASHLCLQRSSLTLEDREQDMGRHKYIDVSHM